jgi:hypothetical protein
MHMDIKKALIILYAVFSVFILHQVATAEDSTDLNWAFFASEDRSKEIYAKKQIQIPCERIDELLRKDDINGVYIAIRDAALFGDKTCEVYIKKNLSKLKQLVGAKDAVAFYYYKNGDPSGLTLLADSYDKEAHKTGDHWTVELFGFINEWEISGRRLVRHAKCCSDAVSGELLCSAIWWRYYLFGKEDFKRYWFKIGKEEDVSLKKLQYFYDECCQ